MPPQHPTSATDVRFRSERGLRHCRRLEFGRPQPPHKLEMQLAVDDQKVIVSSWALRQRSHVGVNKGKASNVHQVRERPKRRVATMA